MQPKNDLTDSNDRSLSVPGRAEPQSLSAPQREAAASIIRHGVDRIYEENPPNQPEAAASVKADDNPYERTHSLQPAAKDWQQYHSAWQDYYQQYYARYYQSQVLAHQRNLHATLAQKEAERNMQSLGEPQIITSDKQPKTPLLPKDIIKKEIRDKVSERAKKVKNSSHFVPILCAVIVGTLFLGFEYNKLIAANVMAYIAPSSAQPADIIIDPNNTAPVTAEPKIIIPKISMTAPVDYAVKSLDNTVIETALKRGVVHYPIPGADAMPGEIGHSVILGHSSNDVFDDGQYKFAFLRLDQLENGDTFYLHYNSIRYTYSVTKKEIILPTEVTKLVYKTDKPVVSLVTCTPIGTAEKRLVVTAEQVSPDPSNAKESADNGASGSNPTAIPGNNKSFLENLFGN